MTVWMVGGCVRNALLGLPVKERDWVVVGETPERMLARGFKQVGADFPVFLHPQTKEEYALARTERKTGRGYKGFAVDFSAGISLEEDLFRRDLTINAMAMDVMGTLIDPFGGREDLERRLLRHVSPAFAEDPLRVLRVARFQAQLAALGFVITPATMTLMAGLVQAGELADLTVERVWLETVKALESEVPAVYFRVLDQCGALEVVFPEIAALKGKIHSPQYHPEGDAFEHALLTLEYASAVTSDPVVRFAAFVHDLGKGETPIEKLPHHYGHEERGARIVAALCNRMRAPKRFARLALLVAAHHMRCHRVLEMRPGKVMALLEALDALRQPAGLEDFVMACSADVISRGEVDVYPAGDVLRACLRAVKIIDVRPLLEAGLQGSRLGEALRQERIHCVKQVLKSASGLISGKQCVTR
ncbi:MAG: multifunctional CCA addition/repair protein [Magnetococcus sp. YQC-5]